MRFMRYLAGLALLFPFSVQAGNKCTFTTECFEQEACQDTQFQLEFRASSDGSSELELVTDAETVGVSVGGSGQVAYLAGLTPSGFHVLTVTRETGAARYTNHIGDGPLVASYIGTCEVGG